MDSRLLVPATPALLDGWCGPALAEDRDGNWSPVTVIALARPDVQAAWVVDLDLDALDERADEIAETCDGRITEMVSFAHLALDLSRAECRDRVARVLHATLSPSRRHVWDLGLCAPAWGAVRSSSINGWGLGARSDFPDWVFVPHPAMLTAYPNRLHGAARVLAPSLASIDANDDRAALAAVAREVLRG